VLFALKDIKAGKFLHWDYQLKPEELSTPGNAHVEFWRTYKCKCSLRKEYEEKKRLHDEQLCLPVAVAGQKRQRL
jgi:hypothetical protein